MHCAHTVYLCLILSSQDRLRTLTEYCAVRCEPNLYVQCKADRLQFGLQPSRCVNQSKYQIKELFYSVGTQQIIYYQSINLATCFGSSSHHQAKSQTILKVHSVDVHIVGSQMVKNRMAINGTDGCLQPVYHRIIKLSQYVVIKVF